MLIDCPACARSYHVSRAELGEHGRTVICPRCDARWMVDAEGRPADDLATAVTSARVAPQPPLREPRPSLGGAVRPLAVAIACIAGLMALIGARDHVVRLVPRAARLYALAGLPVNIRGLAFEKVATMRLDRSTITVSGEIRNVATHRVTVPRMAYEIRDPTGAALVSWTEHAPVRALGPGQTLVFAALPHDAPREGETVSVHFVP